MHPRLQRWGAGPGGAPPGGAPPRGLPRIGPVTRDWQAQGAVSRRAKRLATAMMALAGLVMLLTAPRLWMAVVGIGCMAIVALWLWRRPEPR